MTDEKLKTELKNFRDSFEENKAAWWLVQYAIDCINRLENDNVLLRNGLEQIDSAYQTLQNRIRKETAKEILQTLYCFPHEYHESKIIELAKQYGVEVDE